MWFILGMMAGASLSSGNPSIPLGDIPFRCLVALDRGDAAYMECRRLSLAAQMYAQYSNTPDYLSEVSRATIREKINEALALELKGLRAAEQAAKGKQ